MLMIINDISLLKIHDKVQKLDELNLFYREPCSVCYCLVSKRKKLMAILSMFCKDSLDGGMGEIGWEERTVRKH